MPGGAAVHNEVPEEAAVEWLLIVEGSGRGRRNESWECWGAGEVREHLTDYDGEWVVTGRMPDRNPRVARPDVPILSAIVPRSDGSAHRGVC